MIRELTCGMLSELGYAYMQADCAERAVEAMELHPVDLVVTDYSMGEMTGLDLIDYIKRTHPTTPAILASGCDAQAIHTDVVVLPKPFVLDGLERAIRAAFARYGRHPAISRALDLTQHKT